MKTLLLFVTVLFTGCAFQHVSELNPETKVLTRYTGLAFLNRSSLEGLAVGKKTKTSSAVFTLQKAGTETQTEAFTAIGEAIGAGIAAGAKSAVKP